MISERYAVAPRASGIVRRPRSSVWDRLGTQPATAGRERLLRTVSGSTLAQLMVSMSCIAVAFLLFLAQASQVSVLQYNIADLQSRHADLSGTNAALQSSLTTLRSAARIDQLATTQLHMVPADFSSTIWISPSFPEVTPPQAMSQDLAAAQHRSQPLAWIAHALRVVRASL